MTNGCFNRNPFQEKIMVQDGYIQEGQKRIPKMIEIPSFAYGSECKYTLTELGKVDKLCDGCNWRSDAKSA